MSSQIIDGTNSGRHIIDGPLTITNSNEAAPGLLRNAIDQRIVKVRPMSTPIDQLSRCAGARNAGSMVVEYYSVDNKPTQTQLSRKIDGGEGIRKADNIYTHVIYTDNDLFFEPSETILLPDVNISDGDSDKTTPLVLYVVRRVDGGGLEVMIVNNFNPAAGPVQMPAIESGTKLIRMGRAASELDVQTAQFQALPTKASNNCQIFKMQIEESTFHKIANKEVGWTFSDQEEAAIIDMRLGMEKNFLFGFKSVLYDPAKNENVYLTGGIWNQAGKETTLPVELKEGDLIRLCSQAFTGTNGSKRKIFIAGTGLINRLSEIQTTKVRQADAPTVKWGLEFREIRSNFGTLYIMHSEIFDQCGHTEDGLIIDPDNLTKYVHVPFHAEKIDLRRSGTRNTSAVVLTEASCVVLRFPNAHMRVTAG